ncbi:MAG: hypothetical protein JXA06_05740 [Bacteroidetes bacterium]|nr:hypothetical protein [Bacteroidota bacterium]
MQTRVFKISVLILIIFSVFCSRIPLLNYLGFEFSFFTVLLAGFLCGILTLSYWKKSECKCKADVWKFAAVTFSVQLVLLAVPFFVSLLNALFVKNCSIGDGIILYILIVIPGAVFSAALAMTVGILFKKWQKTIFTFLFILIILHIPAVTYFHPQIFAFNLILGFFPGFTYDETLQVIQRLLNFRLLTLAFSGVLISSAVCIWYCRFCKNEITEDSQRSFPLTEAVIIAVLVPLAIAMFTSREKLGFASSKHYIQQKLAGNHKTEHFEIIYPAGSVKKEKIELIGRLHEFYYSQVSRVLKVTANEPIVSFIYSTPEEKGRLTGAGSTDITKPWLYQMHINIADVGAVLKHELVHVMAGEFGWSPLKVSLNSGLIEGVAVAVGDEVRYDEPLHRSAAMVFAAGIQPDMNSIFSVSGFVKTYAGVSYTIAGSFCKFLIDSLGMDKFKELYAIGDFDKTYQRDFSSLVSDWERVVLSQNISTSDSIKAHYLFKRSSIFGKECARVIANLNSETKKMIEQYDFEKALLSAEKSLSLSKTPQAVFQKAAALIEMQRYKEMIEFGTARMNDSAIASSLLPLHLKIGDAYWAIDSVEKAKQEYKVLKDVYLSTAYDEACVLRLESLKDGRAYRRIQAYFIRSMEDTNRIELLSGLNSPVAAYLLAGELIKKEKFGEACGVLEQMNFSGYKSFEFYYYQRLAKVYYYLKEWKKAELLFSKALSAAPTASAETEINEWLERCEFELKPT